MTFPDDRLQTPDSVRLAKYEAVFAQASITRDVYGSDDMIAVEWPPEFDDNVEIIVMMQHETGRIYAQSNKTLSADDRTVLLRKGLNARDGFYHAILRPKDYYNGLKAERAIPFYVTNGVSSNTYYGDLATRRIEALRDAAGRGPDVFSELARLAAGERIRERILLDALEQPDARSLLGLLFMVGRFGKQLPVKLAATMNSVLRQVDYETLGDEPLALACRSLAAFIYHYDDYAVTEDWLHRLASDGFDFLSPLADTVLALAALVELVDDVAELAAVVLDKLLYTIALHPTEFSLDGRLSALSPITRLMWGLGTYNHHHATCVVLACAEGYDVPTPIQAIAIDPGETLAAQDAHRSVGECVQRTVYRTREYGVVSVGQRWLAELDHVRIFNMEPVSVTHSTDVVQVGASPIYWPHYDFDDWSLKGQWVFGQVGTAAVAIYSSEVLSLAGTTLIAGDVTCWCTTNNGRFEDFVTQTMADGLPVPRPSPLPAERHYQSQFCQSDFEDAEMAIQYKDYLMRLIFSEEK